MYSLISMTEYTFFGRVFPERACVGIDKIVDLPLGTSRDGKATIDVKLSIAYSQIGLKVTNIKGVADLSSLKNSVANIARMAVDIIGYQNGCGYDIEITGAVDNDGNMSIFGVQEPAPQAMDGRMLPYGKILLLSAQNLALRRSLADLRLAIRTPEDTVFYSWRSIEAIMQHFKTSNNEALAWERMKDALNIEKTWVDQTRQLAHGPRHGVVADISGEQRVDSLKCSWRVIDRFVAYLEKGEPVSKEEYPVLS